MEKNELKFYSLDKILALKCQYNIVIGERSNGKTYAALKYGLERYLADGSEMAYIRRWKEDMRGQRASILWANHEENGVISQLTDGEYDRVVYQSGRWYLGKWDEDLQKSVRSDDPFCYGFSLSDAEHDKSTAYPRVRTIIFDEFLTRGYYLPNEFITLMNVLSTIIRHRNDATIFMLANTVNKYAPYFKEMGLKNVDTMKQGSIDVYTYGDSNLRVAVEYCASNKEGKKSDDYFAFDNPSLQMITGGAWELELHPHLPLKYKESEVIFRFFIKWQNVIIQGNCVTTQNTSFIYFHMKTTPIHDEDKDIIYSTEYDPRPNWNRNIVKCPNSISKRIGQYFKSEKVYYQDNDVGELVRNYIMACQKNSL